VGALAGCKNKGGDSMECTPQGKNLVTAYPSPSRVFLHATGVRSPPYSVYPSSRKLIERWVRGPTRGLLGDCRFTRLSSRDVWGLLFVRSE
jgi:hypothetical protein